MPIIDQPRENLIHKLIFAHGAGAGADSNFIINLKTLLSALDVDLIRLNFDYMQLMLESGKRRPPERINKLTEQFHQMITELQQRTSDSIWIGGKSMGGRIATMLHDTCEITGIIVCGYPFHPIGKPDKLRIEHLSEIELPTLIVQGERDEFGNLTEVSNYKFGDNMSVKWLKDGDHSFKPRVKSGFTQQQHLATAANHIANFIKQQA
ncbi:MAG: alpha/beta family hydrolase [Kangiellaceae bacterium]|nr:alpha/beta family hydrolase [Kangiellaceae bacterium]